MTQKIEELLFELRKLTNFCHEHVSFYSDGVYRKELFFKKDTMLSILDRIEGLERDNEKMYRFLVELEANPEASLECLGETVRVCLDHIAKMEQETVTLANETKITFSSSEPSDPLRGISDPKEKMGGEGMSNNFDEEYLAGIMGSRPRNQCTCFQDAYEQLRKRDEEIEAWRKSMHEQIQHYDGLLSKRDDAIRELRTALEQVTGYGNEKLADDALAAATKILGEGKDASKE